MNYVIFSIDDVHEVHTLAKFTHTVDVHRVMQRMQGDMKICVGHTRVRLRPASS